MSTTDAIDRTQQRVGPVWLTKGTSRYNLYSLLVVAFFSIGLTSFINTFQGYILTEHLNIDSEMQGSVTSYLSILQEIMMICLLGPMGALSDKIGRRPIMVAGYCLLALGFFLYPTADSIWILFVYRVFYAVGAICVVSMLPTIQGDYPQDSSRGKLIGMCGALQGVGVALAALFLMRLPTLYTDLGAESAIWAGRYSLWTVAAVCLSVAVIARMGLRPGVPQADSKDENFLKLMETGVRAARNPRILLSYFAAFVSRGDLVIVSNFMTLWLIQVGTQDGLSIQESAKQAGLFLAMVQSFALVWAPCIGFIIDRFNRVMTIIIAVTLAAIGYINVGLMDDPFGPGMYVAAILLGMGEISGVLASQALIGQEAPNRERGSVFGTFGMFGAVGILIALAVGGQLFDSWRPSAPFLMMGIANVFLLVLAIYVYAKYREPSEEVLAAARGDATPKPESEPAGAEVLNAANEHAAQSPSEVSPTQEQAPDTAPNSEHDKT